MSLHIMYDHQCQKCEAYYIPFDTKVACPNCGLVEEERSNIVSLIVASANYQMKCYGYYTPFACWKGSFGDYVAFLVFKVLDKFYTQSENSFEEVALKYVNESKWGQQLYLKRHVRDLSYRVYQEIEKTKVK